MDGVNFGEFTANLVLLWIDKSDANGTPQVASTRDDENSEG
jgi:hypothetical protein